MVDEFNHNLPNRLLPITNKIKDAQFTYIDKDKKILDSIIEEIGLGMTISQPDLNKSYILFMDASDHTIGAILQQQEKVIGVFSLKLLDCQQNYSIVEKEAFTIIVAMQHFRIYSFA